MLLRQKKPMKNTLAYSVGMAFLLPVFAWAGSIQSVTGSVQGGGEVVRIVLDEPPQPSPPALPCNQPARIAFNFLSTTNGLPQSLVELNQGNLNTANVVEASGRTRVVLNLKSATNYRTELDGNAVLVYLDPVKTAWPWPPSPPRASNASTGPGGIAQKHSRCRFSPHQRRRRPPGGSPGFGRCQRRCAQRRQGAGGRTLALQPA